MEQAIIESLKTCVIEGDIDQIGDLTNQAMGAGLEPMAIINQGLMPAMTTVGEYYASGDYFLPNLIISANTMQIAMDLLKPALQARGEQAQSAGKVVIGTVRGDIHEIGKSLVGTMLAANGFEVCDLGVDVETEKFVEKVREMKANLVGLSSLLTTTMPEQQKVISALQAAGLRSQVKVIVGGAPVSESWASEIGADGYAEDAVGAVRVARSLMA